jgi:hypothetical protein
MKWILGTAAAVVYVPLVLGGDKVADKIMDKIFEVPVDMYLAAIVCVCVLVIALSCVSKWDRT